MWKSKSTTRSKSTSESGNSTTTSYDSVCVTKGNYVGNTDVTIPYSSGYNGKCDYFFGGAVPEFNGVDWTSSSCDRFNAVQKDILEKAGECCGGKPVACVSNTPATDYS